MSSKTIHFYFDYLSPYAYFAWRKLPSLAKKYNYQIEAHPIVFGKGIPLFGGGVESEIRLKFIKLVEYNKNNGIFQYQYKVLKT